MKELVSACGRERKQNNSVTVMYEAAPITVVRAGSIAGRELREIPESGDDAR